MVMLSVITGQRSKLYLPSKSTMPGSLSLISNLFRASNRISENHPAAINEITTNYLAALAI